MKVYIVGGGYGEAEVFTQFGHTIIEKPGEADALLFTGGEDICPEIYGEKPIRNFHNIHRDLQEIAFFNRYPSKWKLGICRGAQLLTALSGGKLYQHVNNHSGVHPTTELSTGAIYETNSVHHQMMILPEDGTILATANEATLRETQMEVEERSDTNSEWTYPEVEAMVIPRTKSFGFQAHPEFNSGKDTATFFFKLLQEVVV